MTNAFTPYQTDYLFLLVGENPLPNYVAAKLLLKTKGTLFLVYSGGTKNSKGTKEQADRLGKILAIEQFTIESVSLENYESDAYRIQNSIQECLDLKTNDLHIGLHYSGGTKPMAVHAYRTILEYTNEQQQEVVFSYLNSRQLKICIDRPNNDSFGIPVRYQDLKIQLKTIFELHGRKSRSSKSQDNFTQIPNLPKLATVLAETVSYKEKSNDWFDWYLEVFCKGGGAQDLAARKPPKANGEPGNWKSKTALEELSFTTDKLPPAILNDLKDRGYIGPQNFLLLAKVKEIGDFNEPQKFCKWLDGLWLEHYVLQHVINVSETLNIKDFTDYGLNFEFELAGTKNGFEFDVAFTHGYQLFAISCTTFGDRDGQRSKCKLKLLEAYIRAQQMGGTEARVALVCLADEPDSIKSELADFLKNKQIKVFGRRHLMRLDDEISTWIKENDRGLNQ